MKQWLHLWRGLSGTPPPVANRRELRGNSCNFLELLMNHNLVETLLPEDVRETAKSRENVPAVGRECTTKLSALKPSSLAPVKGNFGNLAVSLGLEVLSPDVLASSAWIRSKKAPYTRSPRRRIRLSSSLV